MFHQDGSITTSDGRLLRLVEANGRKTNPQAAAHIAGLLPELHAGRNQLAGALRRLAEYAFQHGDPAPASDEDLLGDVQIATCVQAAAPELRWATFIGAPAGVGLWELNGAKILEAEVAAILAHVLAGMNLSPEDTERLGMQPRREGVLRALKHLVARRVPRKEVLQQLTDADTRDEIYRHFHPQEEEA